MALLTNMDLGEAQALGAAFGLQVKELTPLTAGSVNSNFRIIAADGSPYFLRVYEEQGAEGAEAERSLGQRLAELGVPMARPLSPLAQRPLHRGKAVGVYEWVAGDICCQRGVTPAVTFALGAALARLHLASEKLESIPEGRFGTAALLQRLDLVEKERPCCAPDCERVRQRLAHYEGRLTTVPTGLTHGDLFRDNALWEAGTLQTKAPKLAALIDFESACRGAYVYDLMVCALSWCFDTKLDAALVSGLFRGYLAVRPLNAEERSQLRVHGALAALRFAATRMTDFELRTPPGEKPARDYRRFLQRLDALESGAIEGILEEMNL